ncbi:hypothetical protein E1166_00715 [Micromonospora sp. KC213]|nr:hypothetical protein E1166_00715 [Micromonospora sp. KC213]
MTITPRTHHGACPAAANPGGKARRGHRLLGRQTPTSRQKVCGSRAIARRLKMSRNTAKKALASDEPPRYRRAARVRSWMRPSRR